MYIRYKVNIQVILRCSSTEKTALSSAVFSLQTETDSYPSPTRFFCLRGFEYGGSRTKCVRIDGQDFFGLGVPSARM